MEVYRVTEEDMGAAMEVAQALGRKFRGRLVDGVNLYFWEDGRTTVEVYSQAESNGLFPRELYRVLAADVRVKCSAELLSVEDSRLRGYYLRDGDALAELFLGVDEFPGYEEDEAPEGVLQYAPTELEGER